MSTEPASLRTFADLVERLGDISLDRIRLRPLPGTATEKDVLKVYDREKRRCELVDGVLVEKAMGLKESLLAMVLGHLLMDFLEEQDLGLVLGEAAPMRLQPRLVRIPDVSFVSWDRLPQGQLPDEPIPDFVPDLAVEVVSKWNTKKEMDRKIGEYFQSGVRLVWLVQPEVQAVDVYTTPEGVRRISKNQVLDGGDVLPGFRLPVKELFARTRQRMRRKSR